MYGGYSYVNPNFTISSTNSADLYSAFGAAFGAFIGAMIGFIIVIGIISIIVLIARWQMFKKANRKPWESLIPIHSEIVELELGGVETYWWFLNLCVLVPFVGWIGALVLHFWRSIALSKAFGKETGFGVLMAFFPFVCYPILAFGSAEYVGPEKKETKK